MNQLIEAGQLNVSETITKKSSPFDAEFWFRE